ncbi:pentatricopeptide repeat-containing protein At2g30780-like [Malania oleifera]|uniref:pentatricopeptide repeat-containing protein At2g30780-like n=1 Tax=Malania oleifera TaxID=397392 RepID=UPI0025AE36B0|nr:pentatricopeptide repeat-containing protein At2g30780-like [Malania oleifera]
MALVWRVLAAARRGLRPQFLLISCRHKLLVCHSSAVPSSLLTRLLQEPNSRIRTVLDAEENLTLKSSELSWDSLVTALGSSSPEKARLALEWRLEKMLKDNERDHNHFTELISLCGKIQNVPLAMHAFVSMEAYGIAPTSAVFNALIFACLSSHNLVTALSLFEIMENSECYKPSSDTYNTFISAYASWGNDKAMQASYLAKKAAGFSADLDTYESLISGCFKSKNFDGADKYYEEMMLFGISPNMRILEIMIKVFCERKNYDKVKEFLKLMLHGGWEINGHMAEKLIGLYSKLGRVEEMEQLLQDLMKSNPNMGVLSQVHYGIIRMYALSDRLDDLEYSVGRMLKHGISFKSADDVEKIICSYFRQAAYDRLELFLECVKDSYKLMRSTYDLLIAGYRRAGLSEKLDKVIKDVQLDGVL